MILTGKTNNLEKDKTEIVFNKEQEYKRVLQGTIRPKKGHTLFEFDLDTKEIKRAKFDKKDVVKFQDAVNGSINVKKEITIKENCIYISCLNKKNVVKILKRDYNINV